VPASASLTSQLLCCIVQAPVAFDVGPVAFAEDVRVKIAGGTLCRSADQLDSQTKSCRSSHARGTVWGFVQFKGGPRQAIAAPLWWFALPLAAGTAPA
jgi:hypothetical protein